MLLPPPSPLLTRIELEWDTDDGIFVRQAGRGSCRCIWLQKQPSPCWGAAHRTKILASAYNKDIQNTWHRSNSVYFTPGESAARLCSTFPMDGIALLQYKFPHAQPCSWSGGACGAAAPSQLRQSKNNLPQKHPQNIPLPRQKLPSPQPAQAHTEISQTQPGMLFPHRNFLLLCHWPQTWQGIVQVLTSPCFILQPDQDKTHHFLVFSTLRTLRCQNFTAKWPFTTTTAIKQLAWIYPNPSLSPVLHRCIMYHLQLHSFLFIFMLWVCFVFLLQVQKPY